MNALLFLIISTYTVAVLSFAPPPLVQSTLVKIPTHKNQLKCIHTARSASSLLMSEAEESGVVKGTAVTRSLRATMRATTGFSLTAFRATMRAATGISFSAMYVSFLGFTSAYVRSTIRILLSIFPTGFRYFLQPFLVLYFFPLFVLRTWTSPSQRKVRRDLKESLLEDWNRGIEAAESKLDEIEEDK